MARLRACNSKPIQGNCVLYVMSRDQRVSDNFALHEAQQAALQYKLPLAVVFCLAPRSGQRAREHYEWMLQGLKEVERTLNKLSIPFMLLLGPPSQTLMGLLHHTKPAAIYFDFNPLAGPTKLRKTIARQAPCAVFEVDTHNIVPAWDASIKQEIGARTLRPKIHRLLADCLTETATPVHHPYPWPGIVRDMTELQPLITEMLSKIPSNGQQLDIASGEAAAQQTLEQFVTARLPEYALLRNDPTKNGQSELSPYLHFGQLWAGRAVIAGQVAAAKLPKIADDQAVFIEELVVRRELSDNFCLYNSHYQHLEGAPQWAQDSLKQHAADKREHVYSRRQFEDAQTHDPAWNAAQQQLRQTGKMHGYMRMYWAKKVLEWSRSAQDALDTLKYLNDFYSLDGGDPNGYVGILWSIAGLHDRPWFDRPVYGVVRYMNYNGLKRKFTVEEYQDRWLHS